METVTLILPLEGMTDINQSYSSGVTERAISGATEGAISGATEGVIARVLIE